MSAPAGLFSKIRWLIRPGESLGQQAANAGVWAFALNMTTRLLRLVRTAVLANLLAPEDFGLMGIAMLVIEFLTNFTQTGFKAALVQSKRGLDRPFLNTAWTVELVRGVVLGVVLFLAAPAVGAFFDTPTATELCRLLAVGLAIQGLANTGVVSFDKDLEFRRRFAFRSTPHVVDLIVSVILAIILQNAWALAWGWVAGRAALVIASYVSHPHRPRLSFVSSAARSMFGFGIWAMGSQILIYMTLNLDDIVVGRVVDATALGLYQMAFTMSQLTTTEITTVVNQVAFPAYSRIQDSPERLGPAYARTLQLVALASFPMAAGLWFIGPVAIETFLGEQWLPMVPAFNVLLLWGLIRSLLATTGPLFQGVGRPSIATKIQFAQLAILAVAIYPMTSTYGVVGAAWATVIAAVGPDVVAVVLAQRVSTAATRDVARAVLTPAVNSGLMLATLVLVEPYLPDGPLMLVWAPLLGAAVYLGTVLVAKRFFGYIRGGVLPG